MARAILYPSSDCLAGEAGRTAVVFLIKSSSSLDPVPWTDEAFFLEALKRTPAGDSGLDIVVETEGCETRNWVVLVKLGGVGVVGFSGSVVMVIVAEVRTTQEVSI